MKRKSGYDWDKKASDYPYLKNTDSQTVPFKIIKDLVDNGDVKRVLDIGCFTGAMAELLADLSIEYLGFDCSTNAIETAKNRVKMQFTNGEIDTFTASKFDLLYFGGMFIYTKYDDMEVMRYLEMCNPKYVLCTDVVRKGFENAYPNLKRHLNVVQTFTYQIPAKRNSQRFLYLFNGKETV